jgi:hypothetical protein
MMVAMKRPEGDGKGTVMSIEETAEQQDTLS